MTIYSLFSDESIKEIETKFRGKGYREFKLSLADLLIEKLEPFRRKRKELLSREVYIREILAQGARKARVIAEATMEETKKRMGLIQGRSN